MLHVIELQNLTVLESTQEAKLKNSVGGVHNPNLLADRLNSSPLC